MSLVPCPLCLAARVAAGDQSPQVVVEHVTREGGLAGAGNAGHHREPAQRHAKVEILEVMQRRALHGECRRCLAYRSPRIQRVPEWLSEKAAGNGCGHPHQVGGSARRDYLAATIAGTGAQVYYVRGATNSVLVVLDDDQGIALGLQLLQGIEQDAVVAGMESDGGLVEDVGDAA